MTGAVTVPPDWSSQAISAAAEKIIDFRGRTPKKLGMSWGGGDIPAISARNVRMGHIDFSEEFYVASDALYRRWMTQGDMERGDALITTEAPLGNVAPVPDDRRYVLSQRVVLIRPRPDLLDKTYFVKILQSPGFQDLLNQNASGSTALGIQRRRLEQLPIPVPPLAEQRQIAQSLQDADDLIATLERMIAKKQAIKQGMMQHLLTGKTRLPGFDQPWVERQVSDIASITKGTQLGRAEMDSAEHVPVWNGGVEPSGYTSTPNVRRAVVTVSEGGNSCGWVGRPEGSFWLGGHCYALDPRNEGHTVRFLYHRLKSVEPQIMGLRVGSGLPNIQKKRLAEFGVSVPTDPKEAAALTAVLDDADAEVRLLDRRITKALSVKTGMMQELLTGRTRLRVEEGAA